MDNFRTVCLFVLTMLFATVQGFAEGPASPSEDLLAGPAKGPWRRLFLDAMVVEQQTGLGRVFHAAEKHPQKPVLKVDKPWEGRGYGVTPHGGTVMVDGGKLRMWYIGGHTKTQGYRVCYAESQDGLTWSKPALGLVEFEGSKDNNIVLDETRYPDQNLLGYTTFVSVIKSPDEKDPARRYALYCYYHYIEVTKEGKRGRFAALTPRVAFSADGLRWTFLPDENRKGLFPSGDVVQFYRDPYQNRYYATWKAGNRRGRAAGVAFSKDGLTWTKPVAGPVFVADDLDPDDTQIYGVSAFPFQGLYVGLPWVYHARWFKHGSYTDQYMYASEKDSPCSMDSQVAWTWDLTNWTRAPGRQPFIALGKEGEFDAGEAIPAKEPVPVGDRLFFYYGGFPGRHNEGAKFHLAATGLAVLRLDGFCSMHAGDQEGWLITRREERVQPAVTINARTAQGGCIVAEILDKDNHVLQGFSREECIPFEGDSVRHVMKWKKADFDESQREGDKKFRFYLRNADLYSYLP